MTLNWDSQCPEPEVVNKYSVQCTVYSVHCTVYSVQWNDLDSNL